MTASEYFDAQMARIDATNDRAEIAAILDEVCAYFADKINREELATDKPGDDEELRRERAKLREMLKAEADSLTRHEKPARETA